LFNLIDQFSGSWTTDRECAIKFSSAYHKILKEEAHMENKPYQIKYEFSFEDGSKKNFQIQLDPKTIEIIRQEPPRKPDWTKLTCKQCTCCTLKIEESAYCPIAVNIAEIVGAFKSMVSSDNCTVVCHTPERTYLKKTSIMEGLSAILGIIMATSNCPVMDFFKPMARFHLPFSTVEETMVRSTSMYLLRQYFEHKQKKTPDLELNKLDQHYAKVKAVNEGLLTRINTVVNEDADKNAIIVLDSLAQIISMEIDYNLDSLAYLFIPQEQTISDL
jgi:hypothetical protein